ncbi:hypothetical protein FBU30_004820 [Linnemannia zychae]|nr:hypothetical protein FBU30_004820 [Linnemannia zychae]
MSREPTLRRFDEHMASSGTTIFKGSIKTNGSLIQSLAFKVHELLSIRYRRLVADKLLNSLVSTVGRTGSFIKEIRNVIRSAEDIQDIWNCRPEEIEASEFLE